MSSSVVKFKPKKNQQINFQRVKIQFYEQTQTHIYTLTPFIPMYTHTHTHSHIEIQSRGHLVADVDPLGITTSAPREIGGTKRRANENVTRKYFNFGKEINSTFLCTVSHTYTHTFTRIHIQKQTNKKTIKPNIFQFFFI